MLEIFLKGLGIGVAVAAPVGPIGLLCIKRTLARGWATGFATGLGVASADATYGLMVAAGLAVTGLLVAYATPMQIGGGLMIAGLGLMSLRSFFKGHAGDRPAEMAARGGLGGAFATGYALTLSNPMTILAFTALVAGLGAAAASQAAAPYLLVAGVFAGSASWWAILTTAATLARSRLTPAVTRWLDLVSGLVLVAWGLRIVLAAVSG
jgi:threonine/homoserine/homoserine lactone efflux protein